MYMRGLAAEQAMARALKTRTTSRPSRTRFPNSTCPSPSYPHTETGLDWGEGRLVNVADEDGLNGAVGGEVDDEAADEHLHHVPPTLQRLARLLPGLAPAARPVLPCSLPLPTRLSVEWMTKGDSENKEGDKSEKRVGEGTFLEAG